MTHKQRKTMRLALTHDMSPNKFKDMLERQGFKKELVERLTKEYKEQYDIKKATKQS